MSKSIADYVTLDIVQTLQHIYASRLDLSTNMFDGEGRTNLVPPSNVTAICQKYVRRTGEGMSKCMESDRRGREYLENALRASCRPEEQVKTESRDNWPLRIENRLHHGDDRHELIGVAYLCDMAFLDFAVPILDPSQADRPAKQGLAQDILSVSYGGQYLRGDFRNQDEYEQAVEDIRTQVSQAANLKDTSDIATLEQMLRSIRRPLWEDISVRAHMLYILGKAMAKVGFNSWQHSRRPLSWSRDAIIAIYTEAFKIASGASDVCFVGYDRWRDGMDIVKECAAIGKDPCHRKEGRLFRRLVTDPALDYLFVEDTGKDPWHVGNPWVGADLVWAVRGYNQEANGLVNLNFRKVDPRPTDLAMRLMRSLTQQFGDFLSMEPLLTWRTSREFLHSQLEGVLDRLDEVGTVQKLCSHVASTLYGVHTQSRPERLTSAANAVPERPSFQIWLTDGPDYSEEQRSVGQVLTCCAINEKFPDPKGRQHIPEVPLDPAKLKDLLRLPILTPDELRDRYRELWENPAFKEEFSDLKDTDHLMILPIQEKTSGPKEKTIEGLLIAIQPLTEYFTEEGRLVYEVFCGRLAEAIDLIVERKKQQIALDVESMIGRLSLAEISSDTYDQLRAFLQEFIDKVKGTLGVIAVSVFIREGWPFRTERTAPIRLVAESNGLPLEQGKPTIRDSKTGESIPWERFHSVRYEIGSGCTGWAMTEDKRDVVRITNLAEHEKRGSQLPRPSNRYDEVLDPGRPRYGVVWAKLTCRGEAIGIIRASLRNDGLRLTQHDQEVIRGIARTLSGHIEAMLSQARLERWGNELNVVSRYTQAILDLYGSWEAAEAERLELLSWAVLLPIVSPHGFDVSRVQCFTINKRGEFFVAEGVGIADTQENSEEKAEILRRGLRELFGKYPIEKINREAIREMSVELRHLSYATTPRLADPLVIESTESEIEDSELGAALRTGETKVVDPVRGVLRPLDQRFLESLQQRQSVKQPFAYVPIPSARVYGLRKRAFMYYDNLYRKDSAVSAERAKAIGTFVSILGGLQASENTSDELRVTLASIGHDVKNILGASGATKETLVQMAVWRCEVLQSLSYPVGDLRIKKYLGCETSLHHVLMNLRTGMKNRAEERNADVRIEVPPSTNLRFQGDAPLLEAVLWQLMDNAIKFTAIAPGDKRMGIAILDSTLCGFIHLAVWDTGIGTSAEEKAMLGKTWYRGNRQIEGAGIGLLTCRRLLHEWTGLDEQPKVLDHTPKGTEFHIWIPLAV
jgi:signal transduction histidine kinase